MKIFRILKIALVSLTLVSGGLISLNVNADILKHVETKQIGVVINHVISPDGKYVFSTTISPTKVFVHSRDQETGKLLNQIQSFEAKDFISGFSPSFFPIGMVVSPDSKQVYMSAMFGVSGNTSLNFGASVLRFDVGSSGALTYKNRVLTNGADRGLKMTNNGRYMYVGSTGARARVSVLNRASNGNITITETLYRDLNGNELQNSEEISISPDNKSLYVSSVSFDAHLYVFDINQSNGKLTSKKTFIHENEVNDHTWFHTGDIGVAGSGGSGTAVSNDGRFFYSVAGYGDDSDSITIFNRNTDGSLHFLKNIVAPLSSPGGLRILFSNGSKLIISPNQKYLYAHDGTMANIGVWKRNTLSGDLSFAGIIKDGLPAKLAAGSSYNLALSKDSRHLYLNAAGGIVVFDLRADLSLVKTDAIDPVNVSGTIDYTLAITNENGSDAHNVVITDTLPTGTSFLSGSVNSNTGSCSANGQIVTCTMGTVTSGSGYNAVIKVKAPNSKATITNTATVFSDQLDTRTNNNTDTETTTIGSGGTTTTPGKEKSSGGSLPLGLLLMLLLPAFLRNKKNQFAK